MAHEQKNQGIIGSITWKHWAAGIAGFVIAVVAVFSVTHPARAPQESTPPAATSTPSVATSTGASTASQAAEETAKPVGPFPINPADAIASWSFTGIYAGNATLINQANADIAHLASLLGKGQYNDYDLYDGIANDYANLGDGTTAYAYYDKAIALYPHTGLAYVNLAHLMSALGAKRTAADAFTKAVTVEPATLEYHVERLTYLTQTFPNDTAMIQAAFADASKQFGDAAPILSIEAKWLTEEGKYADAIKAWQAVKQLMGGQDTSAIDTEIARLTAKLQ